MDMKRYLIRWLIMTFLLVCIVGVFNLVIDPYGLFRLIDKQGINNVKPAAGTHGALAKAYQVLRINPNGVILGNSRMEVGFDPESPFWPGHARPVFNLALPGTGPSTTLLYLQHVLVNAERHHEKKPKVVVWGIDFMDFLVDARNRDKQQRSTHIPRKDENLRLLANSDGSDNPWRAFHKVQDYAESTFSLAAFEDSLLTLHARNDPFAENLTPLGFNPMRDYLKIEADEGYWAVFRQRDLENIKDYLRRPMDIFNADGRPTPALDDLYQVINLCTLHNVDLYLLIYPYHAHLLETIRITGHWTGFENWKRAIVNIVESQSHKPSTSKLVIWDFSGFNQISMEPVPEVNDRQTKMHWYWEAGHFKRKLGELMLDRMFNHPNEPNGFGELLGPANVEEKIASMRAEEIEYRKSHPQDVRELELVAARISKQQSTQ
jgi:hypothetical protein